MTVGLIPIGAGQPAPLSTKSAGTCSVIVYVPALTANVADPTPAVSGPVVVMLNVAGGPPGPSLVVNVKTPLPPTVFLVTTRVPRAAATTVKALSVTKCVEFFCTLICH